MSTIQKSKNDRQLVEAVHFVRISKFQYIKGLLCLGATLFFWCSAVLYPFIFIYTIFKGTCKKAMFMLAIWFVALSCEPRKLPWLRNLFRNVNYINKSVTVYYEQEDFRHRRNVLRQQSWLMKIFYKLGLADDNPDKFSQEDDEDPTFYAVSPHGIFSFGFSSLLTMPQLAEVRFCFSTLLFTLPFFKTFFQYMNYVGPVEKSFIKRCMTRRESLAIIVGGWEEATHHTYGEDHLYIKHRKGFLNYCIRFNYKIRPVFVFGECNTFRNFNHFLDFRLFLNHLGLPGAVPLGRYNTWIPYHNDIHIVVGKTIEFDHHGAVDDEKMEKYQQIYIDEIKRIHESYGPEFYGNNYKKLKIF